MRTLLHSNAGRSRRKPGAIDDELLIEAKARAARSDSTLNAVIEDALREAFARRSDARRTPVELPTFAGSQLRPGS